MSRTAVITVVQGRHDHFVRQQVGFSTCQPPPDQRCVVAMDDPVIPTLAAPGVHVVECRSLAAGLPLARARNQGAAEAIRRGADLLIFLDVDCIPGPALIDRYLDAHRRVDGDALLCGPVTYLPPAADGYPPEDLDALTDPHPARPAPPPGVLQAESNHDLFWSLSFAVSVATWRRLGGFCEDYAGYGGEDTDLGAVAAARGIPLYWVGGAHAYHQHHAVSDPPVEHLDAIVANARVFRRRWGRWPMTGWLDAFEDEGLITRDGDRITVADAATRSVDA
ncbi:glycosyltransferase family 2 protein [Mycolicibacterium rufum]|uniref:Glycosyltransferase family 2 protein n=1 Tax=Mycolicibacterium rufum TaxID=318424 RepID=A0A9X2YEF0_9MYCO|nr:galactosyltransferase-related protein [Mycolicibacterium rufum]KGI70597.1 sugar transferase [Mycolicibacterium rufum]MCV7072228.1 glycosyltransferase family 2 protein [Mycolicibacterium rufum]ULP37428.1 glycosyltransferase family 2 protein [Mycolicibacterium rufum]